jgi:hypothetical protein
MKYAVAIALAMMPALGHDTLFASTVCLLYGLFSGLFLGRLLRGVAAYRRAESLVQPAAVLGA